MVLLPRCSGRLLRWSGVSMVPLSRYNELSVLANHPANGAERKTENRETEQRETRVLQNVSRPAHGLGLGWKRGADIEIYSYSFNLASDIYLLNLA